MASFEDGNPHRFVAVATKIEGKANDGMNAGEQAARAKEITLADQVMPLRKSSRVIFPHFHGPTR